MFRHQELFGLLEDDDDDGVPLGRIGSNSLAVELTAGGLTQEHTDYVS